MFHITLKTLVYILVVCPIAFGALTDPEDIVIIVLSQSGYSAGQAELLRENIIQQAHAIGKNAPKFILTHERTREEVKGGWTIYPILPILLEEYGSAKWHFFCLDNTVINLEELTAVLSTFNSSSDVWLGHALQDAETTIIHHFADTSTNFSYPNIASGFATSKTLTETLNHKLNSGNPSHNEFTIDVSYEFSKFILDNGAGPRFTHSPKFCTDFHDKCATYPKKFPSCGNAVPRENIFFAVKTFDENHEERIPILLRTWLTHTTNYALFSNRKDDRLRNIIVVPNTNKGHCKKTYTILQHAEKILKKNRIEWLVVSDDDTILGVSRLSHLLSCYDPKEPVAIGERYGYSATEETGYDYLTGGAALAISAPLLPKILRSSACVCPSSTTPDDMFLFGICLARLGVMPTHSPLFHQARPQDYARGYLASQKPVSFHKFWMADPIRIYQQWFHDEDSGLSSEDHEEL